MQDFFYEESTSILAVKLAKTKHILFSIFSIIFYLCTFFFLILSFSLVEFNNFLSTFIPVILILISLFLLGLLFGKIKDNCFCEYDFTIINGNFTVSKIVNQSKRRKILEFFCSEISNIGKVNGKNYNRFFSDKNYKKLYLISNKKPQEPKKIYYITINCNSIKYLLILECSEKLLLAITKFTGRIVLDGDITK